jgi:hypothetical protein
MGKLQERIGADGVERYKEQIRLRESGSTAGKYTIENSDGYIGAYQFGAQALQDRGLIKPDIVTEFGKLGSTKAEQSAAHKALLDNPNNWTIEGGKQAFLSDKKRQDDTAVALADRNVIQLERDGTKLNPSSPPEQVAGMAGAAHAVGATGVINYGLARTDGNGTPASEAYKSVAGAVSGNKNIEVPEGTLAGKLGQGKPGQTEKTGTTNSRGDVVAADNKPAGAAPFTGKGIDIKKTGVPDKVSITAGNKVNAIQLPVANPLTQFTSFNSIITLSSLSADQYNFPEKSYKAGDIGRIILRSAGAGAKAQRTSYTTSFNTKGQYDFHIDNLELKSLMSFNADTKGTSANLISFEVYEPYSMGLFPQALSNAALDNLHTAGPAGSPFLITIEFVGWNNDGKPVTVPNTTRHIPVTITDIDMTVKASGCVYKVQALAANEMALTDNHNLFKTDIAISGTTVQEILQTGEFSLQTVLNKRLQEMASKENVKTGFDEIVIVFPKDVSESVTPKKEEEGSAKKDTSTLETKTVLPSALTVSRASGALLKQEKDTLNYIGASSMDFNSGQAGEPAVIKLDDAHTDASKPAQRDKVVFDTKTRQMMFSQGTTIVNAITKVLTQCKHCKDVISGTPKVDDKGMVDWFRIETQILLQPPLEGNAGKGEPPKLLIFKVVPYKVHAAKKMSPNGEPLGYTALKQESAKVYDYLYSGKNTEILDFDIAYKSVFFSTMSADQGKADGNTGTTTQQSQTGSDAGPNTPNSAPGQHEPGSGRVVPGQTLGQSSPDAGGSTATDYRVKDAQRFQKELYDNKVSMINVTMKIFGDPYYLADSGLGNFSNSGSGRFNITKSGAMDYQSGEVDVLVSFRTPLDYDPTTGIMNFGNNQLVSQFSGLYKVNEVTHKFNKGKFTQELTMQRRVNQNPVPDKAKIVDLSNSTKYTDGTSRSSAAGVDAATANPNGQVNKVAVLNTSKVALIPGTVPAGPAQVFGKLGSGTYGQ